MPPEYDVVVIGGGIHGVGVAQSAAARGYSVLVLEKNALAAGTSSKSSKLIHGGLRYLERFELGLVRECLRERTLLLRLAPDLVKLQPFILPIFRTTTRRPWKIRVGLSLYGVLAGFGPGARFRGIPRHRWGDLDGLVTEDLDAVFEYHDAQTDDAALTAAVMQSASRLGAELAMPATFKAASIGADGCRIDYEHDGNAITCRAATLVNAAGPWAHRVQPSIQGGPPPRPVELVQGAHIELAGRVEHGIYYVESPRDRRAVFVMPWGDRTLVGTTETTFEGDPPNPDKCEALPDERQYLTEVVDRYFPRYEATEPGRVLDAWAGLRVLPAGEGRAFSRTRETIFDVDDPRTPRTVTIYGGKLTSYRADAEKVLHRLAPSLPTRRPRDDTAEMPLTRVS